MNPELSIIITSYKNPSVLKLCLGAIGKNILNQDYETLVLDSSTEEDTEIMIREEFPEVKFFPSSKNLGFARLVNRGIRTAKGKYYLILNADIIAERRSVDILVEYLKNNPDVGIAGPKLLNFDGKLQNSCFRFYTPMTILFRRTFLGKFGFAKKMIDRFLMKDADHNRPHEVDWIMGSALATSRLAVKKTG